MDYIKLKIHNYEPLKIGSSNSSETSSFSKEYIAGSAIRGAVIGALIRNGFDIKNNEAKKDLLSKVKFTNAYISFDNERTIPFPAGFLAEKKALASYDGGKIAICSIYDEGIKEKKPVKKEPFCTLASDTIKGVSVKRTSNLHIGVNGRNDGGSTEKQMFRYEALDENQDFIGYIVFESTTDIKDKIIDVLQTEKVMYIGGSKGSGYGRATVEIIENNGKGNPEKLLDVSYDGGNEIYIYYLSDTVIQNIYGESIGYIDRDTFKALLGDEDLNISYAGGAVDNVIVSGYNNTYGGTLPQYLGIKAGSVQKYTIEGSITNKLITKLNSIEEEGLGIRTEEGYGRILFTKKLNFTSLIHANEEYINLKDFALDLEAGKQLEIIGRMVYLSKCREGMKLHVYSEANKIDYSKATIKKSQLGKTIEQIQRGYNLNPAVFKKEVNDWLSHNASKKNNLTAHRMFIDTKIDGISLKEYIQDLVDKVDKRILFESSATVKNKELKATITTEDIYSLNLDYMVELFTYIRKEVSK